MKSLPLPTVSMYQKAVENEFRQHAARFMGLMKKKYNRFVFRAPELKPQELNYRIAMFCSQYPFLNKGEFLQFLRSQGAVLIQGNIIKLNFEWLDGTYGKSTVSKDTW